MRYLNKKRYWIINFIIFIDIEGFVVPIEYTSGTS